MSAAGQRDGDVLTGGGGRDGGQGGGGSLMTWISRKSMKSVSTKGTCARPLAQTPSGRRLTSLTR